MNGLLQTLLDILDWYLAAIASAITLAIIVVSVWFAMKLWGYYIRSEE